MSRRNNAKPEVAHISPFADRLQKGKDKTGKSCLLILSGMHPRTSHPGYVYRGGTHKAWGGVLLTLINLISDS